jgi:biopolymer transport protein ExbD
MDNSVQPEGTRSLTTVSNQQQVNSMQSDGFFPSRKINRRGNRYWVDLNLWPFVGVLLVLLVIMMLYPGRGTHGLGTDLAVVSHPVSLWFAAREDAIRIAVTRDDNFYLGNSKVTITEIPQKIRESAKNGSEKRTYMEADGRAKYGSVERVLDKIRDVQIEKVSFVVYKKR